MDADTFPTQSDSMPLDLCLALSQPIAAIISLTIRFTRQSRLEQSRSGE
jgi:hypothetical protein